MIASATARMGLRLFMLIFWILRNASVSLRPCVSIKMPLARSTVLRVSSASVRLETSRSITRNSLKRASATSMAGVRSLSRKGLTR